MSLGRQTSIAIEKSFGAKISPTAIIEVYTGTSALYTCPFGQCRASWFVRALGTERLVRDIGFSSDLIILNLGDSVCVDLRCGLDKDHGGKNGEQSGNLHVCVKCCVCRCKWLECIRRWWGITVCNSRLLLYLYTRSSWCPSDLASWFPGIWWDEGGLSLASLLWSSIPSFSFLSPSFIMSPFFNSSDAWSLCVLPFFQTHTLQYHLIVKHSSSFLSSLDFFPPPLLFLQTLSWSLNFPRFSFFLSAPLFDLFPFFVFLASLAPCLYLNARTCNSWPSRISWTRPNYPRSRTTCDTAGFKTASVFVTMT